MMLVPIRGLDHVESEEGSAKRVGALQMVQCFVQCFVQSCVPVLGG